MLAMGSGATMPNRTGSTPAAMDGACLSITLDVTHGVLLRGTTFTASSSRSYGTRSIVC